MVVGEDSISDCGPVLSKVLDASTVAPTVFKPQMTISRVIIARIIPSHVLVK